MTSDPQRDPETDDAHDAFVREGQRKRSSSVGEMVHLSRSTKKWWLLPLTLLLVVLGVVLLVTSTGAGPLLYTLF